VSYVHEKYTLKKICGIEARIFDQHGNHVATAYKAGNGWRWHIYYPGRWISQAFQDGQYMTTAYRKRFIIGRVIAALNQARHQADVFPACAGIPWPFVLPSRRS